MNTTRHRSKTPVNLQAITERLETLEEQSIRLQAQLRLARGTETAHPPQVHGPFWVGDKGSTEELINAVGAAITDRPRTLQELIELTGARRNRVSGAIIQLQFKRTVKNLGDRKQALWFAPPIRTTGGERNSERPSAPPVQLRITLGSRVSTDETGYLGVVTSIAGTTKAPIYTIMTDDGELITPPVDELKLTRGRVPGKDYSKSER